MNTFFEIVFKLIGIAVSVHILLYGTFALGAVLLSLASLDVTICFGECAAIDQSVTGLLE